jgi:hypothetical protein
VPIRFYLAISALCVSAGCRQFTEEEVRAAYNLKSKGAFLTQKGGGVAYSESGVSVISINLHNCSKLTDADLADVAKLKELRAIRELDSEYISDEGLRHLTHLPHLETITMGAPAITDSGLDILSRIRTLKKVTLPLTDRSKMTPEGRSRFYRNLLQFNIPGKKP